MADPAAATRGFLLVVSDDSTLFEEVRSSLPLEIDSVGVLDARQAWAEMDNRRPLAVVVDLQTGSAGGFALAKDMAQDARLSEVPIVMLLDRAQDAWLARQAGAAAHLAKPLRPGAVAESVLSLLG